MSGLIFFIKFYKKASFCLDSFWRVNSYGFLAPQFLELWFDGCESVILSDPVSSKSLREHSSDLQGQLKFKII